MAIGLKMIISYDADQQKDVKVTPKQKAQEELISAMQIAFVRMSEGGRADIDSMTDRENKAVWEQMSKQMARVEKLFGYEPYSWPRGC